MIAHFQCLFFPFRLMRTVPDYDAVRKEVAGIMEDKTSEVRGLVAKLHKTQRAAEEALDKCVRSLHQHVQARVSRPRYEKVCAA